MGTITGKKLAIGRRMLFLVSALMLLLLIFGSASYAMATEGEESAHFSVSSSSDSSTGDTSGDSGDADSTGTGGTSGDSGSANPTGTNDAAGAPGSADTTDTGDTSGDQGLDGDEDGSDGNGMTSTGGAAGGGNAMQPMAEAEDENEDKAEAEAEDEPAGTPTPETPEVPEYQIPDGSAYIIGSEDTVYNNTAAQNAIQQAIEAAKASAQDKVTIVVNDGVYTGGISYIVSAPEGGEGEEGAGEGKKILLQIIAADAYTTNEETGDITANANSAGGVQTEGEMNFDGLDVLLAGIYLSLKDKITVKDADNVTYFGTSLDDEVTLELDRVTETVTIDMGDGNDVLDLSVKQSPTLTLTLDKDSGFDAEGELTDTGKEAIEEAIRNGFGSGGGSDDSRLRVVINGGKGDDEITVTLINSTDINTTKSEGEEPSISGIKAELDLSATDLKVNGEAGTDTITVKGGMELGLTTVILQPILQQIMNQTATLAANAGLAGTEININGGAGDDLINVDTTVSFSGFRGVEVSVDGGAGYDRVHLTGKLEGYENNNNNINGNAESVKMSTLAEITILNEAAAISKLKSDLTVNMDEVEAVTDELANKNSIYINNLLTDQPEFASFTDYVIEAGSGIVNYTNLSGSGAFLANLIINGEDLKIGIINTPNINILISAEDSGLNQSGRINISGTVIGKNILVKVVNTDSHALEIIENDLGDEEDDYGLEASLFDIVSDAAIYITGNLIATQVAYLEAISQQTKPLIPTLEELTTKLGEEYANTLNINFVAVKVGKAIIDIKGKIEAAAIRALANSLVDVSAMNDNLAEFGIPLAVGVVVSEAGLTVSDNAQLIATEGGLFLQADSDVKLATHSVSGLLPFTLAVSAVVNDAYVDVKGNTRLKSEGDTTLSASGWTSIDTSASGPKEENGETGGSTSKAAGQSGGFFAVSVAVQNVFAAIRGNAGAEAKGNLTLQSTAYERVKNEATSSPDEAGSSFSLSNLINKISSLLTKTADNPENDNSDGKSALNNISSKLKGSDNSGTGVDDLVNTGTSGSTGTDSTETTSSWWGPWP